MHTARRAWPCGPMADPALWGGAAEGVGYEVPGVEGGGGGRTAFRERTLPLMGTDQSLVRKQESSS